MSGNFTGGADTENIANSLGPLADRTTAGRHTVPRPSAVGRRERADSFGVVPQVQARPEANLHNVAVSTGENCSPVPGQERFVQEEVAKAWGDYLREEARVRLLTCLAWAGPFVAILVGC
jgi:hypothetical protein